MIFRTLSTILLSLGLLHSAAAQQQAERVDPTLVANPERDRFDFANQFFDAGQKSDRQFEKDRYHQRSVQLFQEFLETFPRSRYDADARYRLGVSQMELGQVADAKRNFRALVRRHPQHELAGLASYRMGSLEWAERDFQASAPHFETAAAVAKGQLRQRALNFAGFARLQLGEKQAAVRNFELILKEESPIDPYRGRAALQIGLVRQEAGQHEKALEYFATISAGSTAPSERGPALLAIAESRLALEQPEQAQITLETLLNSANLAKWHPAAQASLMATAYAAEDFERVLQLYGKSAIEGQGATPAKLHFIAGKAANKLERYTEAITFFARSERADPQTDLAFDAAYRRLLCFYNVEGANIPDQVDAFLEIYRGRHAAHEYIQAARLMKAETLFSQKRYLDAADVYNRINAQLIDKKNRPGLLFHKGWCLAASGDPNGAIQAFSRLLGDFRDSPFTAQALAKRGEAYLQSRDYDKAMRDFDALIEANDTSPALVSLALQKSAVAALEKKNFPQVVDRFTRLIVKFPDLKPVTLANAHYSVGHAQLKLEKYEDAIAALENSRKLDPDTFNDAAGTKIALCYYMLQDPVGLLEAVGQVERDVPGKVLPERMITWLGIKSFERRDYENAVRYLARVIDHDKAGETKAFIWKQYAKANLEVGENEEALRSVNHVLETETNAVSLADAYLDKGRALLALTRYAEAIEAAEEGQRKQPRGLLNAELNILLGDIAYQREDYAASLKYYGTTAEFIADKRLKPIALHRAKVAAEKKGDAALAESYAALLSQNFPDYTPSSDWP